MKSPFFRIVATLFIGLLILTLSSALLMAIDSNTQLFENFPAFNKTFTHTSFIVLSLLFILILGKTNFKEYGFSWSLKFPISEVVLISLFLGLSSSIIGIFLPDSGFVHPAASFSLIEKVLFIWIWASISEEILCRGLIQGFLSPLKHKGIKVFNVFLSLPVLAGAIFFGFMHFALLSMGMEIASVMNIVFFGILLGLIAGYQKERSGSLIPAFLVHLCFNVGASII